MDHLADVPRIPIQQAAGCLIVSVQIDLNRAILERFQRELLERIRSSGVRGVILDLAGVDVLDADDFNQLRATMDMAAIMVLAPCSSASSPASSPHSSSSMSRPTASTR